MNESTEDTSKQLNLSEWHCQLWKFDPDGLLQLRLFIPKERGSKWMTFHDVLYVDSTVFWSNAEIQMGTSEESLKLLRSLMDKPIRMLTK